MLHTLENLTSHNGAAYTVDKRFHGSHANAIILTLGHLDQLAAGDTIVEATLDGPNYPLIQRIDALYLQLLSDAYYGTGAAAAAPVNLMIPLGCLHLGGNKALKLHVDGLSNTTQSTGATIVANHLKSEHALAISSISETNFALDNCVGLWIYKSSLKTEASGITINATHASYNILGQSAHAYYAASFKAETPSDDFGCAYDASCIGGRATRLEVNSSISSAIYFSIHRITGSSYRQIGLSTQPPHLIRSF